MTNSNYESLGQFIQIAKTNKISVLIPARNEENTIGKIVSLLRNRYALETDTQVDIVVIDDHSSDNTSQIAADHGAKVISRNGNDSPIGKGETILLGIQQCPSDIYVLFDADVSNFQAEWLEILCNPFHDSSTLLVKATYQRPVPDLSINSNRFSEGGRVTELVARPLLSMFFPELAKLGQPLSGEFAFRSDLLKSLTLAPGYGIDVGILIDAYIHHGANAIKQVDLGKRHHSHQELNALAVQAVQVGSAIMQRAGIEIKSLPGYGRLVRAGGKEELVELYELEIPTRE